MIIFEKIKLRDIEEMDIDIIHSWENDQIVHQMRGIALPVSKEKTREKMHELFKQSEEFLSLIVEYDGYPIGMLGYHKLCRRSRRAEVWIYIGKKEQWGKGIGTQSLKLFCDYCFDEINIHRLWLECSANHALAINAYKKVGFLEEGVLRDGYYRNGKYHDTVIMGFLSHYRDKNE